jgi:hypothetical protein
VDNAWFDGVYSVDGLALKGEVFTTAARAVPLGIMYGNAIDCTSSNPPIKQCFADTLGDSNKCTDVKTLIQNAADECKLNGLTMGTYSFLEPCPISSVQMYHFICYECCKP